MSQTTLPSPSWRAKPLKRNCGDASLRILVLVHDVASWLRHSDDVRLCSKGFLDRLEEGRWKKPHLLEAKAEKSVTWFAPIRQAGTQEAAKVFCQSPW